MLPSKKKKLYLIFVKININKISEFFFRKILKNK